MAKTKATKAKEAVKEAAQEIKQDLGAEYKELVDKLGAKAAEFQKASKVSAAKHLRNAIRAIRFVIEELEK